jgi:integrase
LLALGTGLGRGDIESLKINDIDFEKNSITTSSRKTRKSMGALPVPAVIMQELKKYLNGSNSEQQRLFNWEPGFWAGK